MALDADPRFWRLPAASVRLLRRFCQLLQGCLRPLLDQGLQVPPSEPNSAPELYAREPTLAEPLADGGHLQTQKASCFGHSHQVARFHPAPCSGATEYWTAYRVGLGVRLSESVHPAADPATANAAEACW